MVESASHFSSVAKGMENEFQAPFSFIASHWLAPSKSWNRFAWVLFALSAASCVMVPFTKVEESFNVQAIHDLVFWGTNWSEYDHRSFPSVVPRSWVGAIVLAAPAKLTQMLLSFLNAYFNLPTRAKLWVLLSARVFLAYCVTASLSCLSTSTKALFGRRTGNLFLALTSIQYHVVFWSSRTLPNTLAFALTNTAFAAYFMAHMNVPTRNNFFAIAVFLLVGTACVLRSELAVLCLAFGLQTVYRERFNSILKILKYAVPSVIFWLLVSVPIDTLFWTGSIPPLYGDGASLSRWRYPELEVFWFNTVQNQSHKWGTLPIHAYLTKFLPRILNVSLFGFLVNAARVSLKMMRRTGYGILSGLLAPCLCYVALLSMLPHKEWRFIVYVIPVFTIAASNFYSELFERYESRRLLRKITLGFSYIFYFAAIAATLAMVLVSSFNYPGGIALDFLHRDPKVDSGLVHIDAYSAMNGVSLFVQYDFPQPSFRNGNGTRAFTYSKEEGLQGVEDYYKFRYTLTNDPDLFSDMSRWRCAFVVYGYSGLSMLSLRNVVADVVLRISAFTSLEVLLSFVAYSYSYFTESSLNFIDSVQSVAVAESAQGDRTVLGFVKLSPKVFVFQNLALFSDSEAMGLRTAVPGTTPPR